MDRAGVNSAFSNQKTTEMKALLFVFLGGGIGSSLRYVAGLLLKTLTSGVVFPVTTFLVNILGSFLIGLFYAASESFALSQEVRLLLTVGLCGGFTTFSTFSNESLTLFSNGNYLTLALYIALSILLGILCVFLGAWLGQRL